MKKIMLSVLVAATFSSAAFADNFKKPEDAIEYRQDVFGAIVHNFGDMGAMMKGKKPFDAKVFEMRAQNVAALSKMPGEGFVAGSDKGDTEAKSDIWSDKADFDAKMEKFQVDAAKLAQVAATGDKKAIKKAFGATAKNCKACHDSYKKD
ncbi:cytochrome c [Shewanella corallii]|uniref:Cytochrome c n=1 Tax=Shewanella corallii TaxID=560080 RepID=A0ABT0N665_9GAMM|nr:cytochrome c [Shewanella corallii]MCL2913381.1 cytochrome c [Shewanella corallii]